MTDLEKHWDDLPVGPAPVDAVLREARRQSTSEARRRPEARLRRSLTTVAALGGIAAAFVAGTLVPDSGGTGAGGQGGSDVATPVAFHGELEPAESCDALLQSYVDRSVDLVSQYGWGPGPYPVNYNLSLDGNFQESALLGLQSGRDMFRAADDVVTATSQSGAKAGAFGGTVRAKPSDTGTNVQEVGVDEPDSVKTDGEVLVRLRDAVLTTYDVGSDSGETLTELGRLDLGDFHDGEILLAGDTVVAVGNDGTRYSPDSLQGRTLGTGAAGPSPQTRVLTVDLGDPAAPSLEKTVDYDATLVAARQHGTDVRLVLSKGLPDLAFETGSTAEANRTLVEATTLSDWLPTYSVDGGKAQDLLSCDRVAVPRADLAPTTMAVVGFSATEPGTNDSFGLAGDASLTYESSDHLYLAASAVDTGRFGGCFDCFSRTTAPGSAGGSSDGTTHVYDFTLDGISATYVGAGEVEGSVRDRWSMDEYDGVLRLAVGPSSETGAFSSVVTMRADGDRLVEIGRLDRLGVNEDIQAVRWFDGLALVVTYRRIDPLYAIDLTDPTKPLLKGELKIPGFSSYLHPLGTKRVLGIGSDGRSRAQAGFFDVTDLADVRRLDVVTYDGGTEARAGDDPRQFTWLPDARVALTVIVRRNEGYVSELKIADGSMTNTMTRVEYGRDVDAVRLVPVGGGRVVLVTGEDVEYFDVT